MSRIDEILELVAHVYDAALNEEHWSALAPQIARTFRSTSTTVQIQEHGKAKALSVTENVSAELSSYRAYFWQRDIWIERATKLGISRVVASKDIVADREFRQTEFYRDWCRKLDVFYVVGAVFPTGDNALGVIGIHRPIEAGGYEEGDKLLVSRFLPHLQRALQIRNQIAQTSLLQRVSLETLERTDVAAIIVSANGHIIYASPNAETLLADGSALRVHKGRVVTGIQSDLPRLMSLIRSASAMGGTSNEPGGIMAVRQSNKLLLSVLVAPFRLSLPGMPVPGAVLFIRDQNRLLCTTAALRALFQLTPAEAHIAQALVNGKSIDEIALSKRANPATVRKQLKSVFLKTGTNRQAQCVATILRSIMH
jgi:DNA-binding CsgD family transcriptional regulator